MPAKSPRIFANLDKSNIVGLPGVGNAETEDFIIASLPAIVIAFLMTLFPRQFFVLGLVSTGVALLIGFLFLIAVPKHTSLSKYARNYWSHLRSPNQMKLLGSDEESDELDEEQESYETGSSRSQDVVDIQRIYPDADVALLDDGSMVGVLEVHPPNLERSTAEERQRVFQSYTNFFKKICEFPIQIYITSSRFEVRKHLDAYQYEQKQFAKNPEDYAGIGDYNIWEDYTQQYRDFMVARFSDVPIRRYYVIVRVDEEEKKMVESQQDTVRSGIERIPILRSIPKAFSPEELDEPTTEEDERREQLRVVEERLNTVRSQMVSSINGAEAERVSGDKYGALLYEFWNNEQNTEETKENFLPRNEVMNYE